jgi:ubiquinone/menaquinone biosynthesis C-methylase UbiE
MSFTGACLNAGCGEGLYIPFIESLAGITAIKNVDLNDPVDLASVHTDVRHRFVQGSLTELPCENAEFECSVCTEVLEHIPDHGRAVAELARVIKPGGLLLVSVPQTPAPWDPSHVRQGYTFQELHDLLSAGGFRVVARQDCLFLPTRAIMHYWRRPWIRFGAERSPYLPRLLVCALAWLDRKLRLGKPWDLVLLAMRR